MRDSKSPRDRSRFRSIRRSITECKFRQVGGRGWGEHLGTERILRRITRSSESRGRILKAKGVFGYTLQRRLSQSLQVQPSNPAPSPWRIFRELKSPEKKRSDFRNSFFFYRDLRFFFNSIHESKLSWFVIRRGNRHCWKWRGIHWRGDARRISSVEWNLASSFSQVIFQLFFLLSASPFYSIKSSTCTVSIKRVKCALNKR